MTASEVRELKQKWEDEGKYGPHFGAVSPR